LKAKMVEFCGWSMPIQYGDEGIIPSHLHCRTNASLFDVSHMSQLRLYGKDRQKFLESLVVADLDALPVNHATLSVFTNERGGIIDDTIITKRDGHFHVVVNAGCADKDWAHLTKQLAAFQSKGGDVKLEKYDRSLVALQGPKAESVLASISQGIDLAKMPFMTALEAEVAGVKGVLVSRCGYTGEDGFEISIPHEKAVHVTKQLLSNSAVKAAALGPRDTLRLEAGLCLYGHDLNEDITPVEGSLLWVIGKKRRETGGFLGAEKILGQISGKVPVPEKRVGFYTQGPPAREGATLHDKSTDAQVGRITSGTLSPVLKKNIAMGYVNTPYSKLNTELVVKIRGKPHGAVVSKMPFVATKYKKLD